MKVIYVAGPFRAKSAYVEGQQDFWGVWQNITNAMSIALEVWRAGAVALCPHGNTFPFQNAAPDDVWLEGDLELLARCDAVIMTPDWQRSTGARAEHEFAKERGIPVLYTIDEVKTFIKEPRPAAA